MTSHEFADPGSRQSTPAAANPPPAPPVPPDAPADPAATGTGPGHGLVPPMASERRRQAPPEEPEELWAAEDGTVPLLDRDERDRLTARLHHAVSGFVDGPRRAVEEADGVFEEAARHLEDALAHRRRVLREPWRAGPGTNATDGSPGMDGSASGAETEELRLALRQYKEATERLLRL